MNGEGGCIAAVLLLVVCVGLFVGGCYLGRNICRVQAIEAGVAEWTVDSKTGECTFRWKAINE